MAFRFGTQRSLGLPIGGGGAILKPQDVFAILAQPANAMQAAINALPFTPDLLIGKDRVAAGDWAYRDSLRGLNLTLASNTTAAEAAWPGYSGTNNRIEYASKIGAKYLAVGTFTHTTGTATNIDLSSLGVVGYSVVKRRDAAGDWYAWHRSLTAGNNLRLHTTAGQSATDAFISVSGTTLTFLASAPSGNYNYQAHAHDPSADGIVQCGASTADSQGAFSIPHGWAGGAQWVLSKRTDAAEDWLIYDTARTPSFSGQERALFPNLSNAEGTARDAVQQGGGNTNVQSGSVSGAYVWAIIRAPY